MRDPKQIAEAGTGNMALIPLAAYRGRVPVRDLFHNLFFVLIGTLLGSVCVAYFLAWWDAIHNWIFAFLGNLVGAAIFVAGGYWYLYARPEPDEPTAGGIRATPDGAGSEREAASSTAA